MDQYKIEQKIAQGLLAMVYKVTKVDDKNNIPLIMKEVECQDLKSAQHAQNEYKIFCHLNHQYLCKIQESFIKWDKKLSSAFVCYVMEYFEKADLMNYINNLRSKQEIIPIEIIDKWIGYIVDGVNYLHENKIIHRNLKPSSFYFKTIKDKKGEKEILQICDYGVKTVMFDAKTKTRYVINPFNYAAPEIIDGEPFDYKSDIWAIGTTLLDVCTTSLYDHKTFHSHLLNIRFDDELLLNILDQIEKIYESKSLSRLLKLLLNKEKEKRPSIKEIINNHYVQHCLETIDSNLVIHLDDLIHTDYSSKLLNENSIEKLKVFLNENLYNEPMVQASILKISDLIDKQEFNLLDQNNQSLLYKLMLQYGHNHKIQSACLKIVESSLSLITKQKLNNNQKIESNFLNLEFLKRFFYIFLKYENSKEIQLICLKILIHFSNFENISNELASYDVIKYLLDVLNRFESDSFICGYACKSFWCLCQYDSIIRTLKNKRCLVEIKNCLLTHKADPFCAEMATNVVIALCSNEMLIAKEEVETDVTTAILICLKHHLDLSSFVKSACIALSTLISFLEECAFRFIYILPNESDDTEIDGVHLLRIAYHKHRDEADVVEHICSVFKELSNYDEMITELKSIKLNETLINDISKRFRDNININELCHTVNSRIENRIKMDVFPTSV